MARMKKAEAEKQKGWYDAIAKISDIIKKDATTDDVRPIVRGKWIEKKAIDGQRYLQCSVCEKNKMDLTYDDFCKFCGADMREVEE